MAAEGSESRTSERGELCPFRKKFNDFATNVLGVSDAEVEDFYTSTPLERIWAVKSIRQDLAQGGAMNEEEAQILALLEEFLGILNFLGNKELVPSNKLASTKDANVILGQGSALPVRKPKIMTIECPDFADPSHLEAIWLESGNHLRSRVIHSIDLDVPFSPIKLMTPRPIPVRGNSLEPNSFPWVNDAQSLYDSIPHPESRPVDPAKLNAALEKIVLQLELEKKSAIVERTDEPMAPVNKITTPDSTQVLCPSELWVDSPIVNKEKASELLRSTPDDKTLALTLSSNEPKSERHKKKVRKIKPKQDQSESAPRARARSIWRRIIPNCFLECFGVKTRQNSQSGEIVIPNPPEKNRKRKLFRNKKPDFDSEYACMPKGSSTSSGAEIKLKNSVE